MNTGIVTQLIKTTQNKKKKHNKIIILARSKSKGIESRISKALIDNKNSHEDFATIINDDKTIVN